MHWPTSSRRSRPARAPWFAAVLAVGLTAWIVTRNLATPKREPAAVPAAVTPAPGDLPLLQLSFTDADWATLAAARERALKQGVLIQDAADIVPVSVRFGAETAKGVARLKGDWLDHIDSDQWSLRIELSNPVAGMRRFSIQHPKTRGYVMEWIVMAVARHAGILAPRSDFVHVDINDKRSGVYYLEEHFAKELLEAQGRREGPIVRFTEEALWSMLRQHAFRGVGRIPIEAAASGTLLAAAAEGFGEAQLAQVDTLNRRLHRALTQIRDLQNTLIAEYRDRPQRRLQALARLEGRTVDQSFATGRVGDWLALYTVFHCLHGLGWHQLRFYHDPVLDRLEPIAFDTGSTLPNVDGALAMNTGEANFMFMRSPQVWEAAYAALARFTEPEWYSGWRAKVQPVAERAAVAMAQSGILPPGMSVAPIFDDHLPKQLELLRAVARPDAAAGFVARVVGARTSAEDAMRTVEVEAWALTDAPVRVHGFRFPDGRIVPARATATTIAGTGEGLDDALDEAGSLRLPRDGTRVVLRFPLDRRLAHLSDVRALKAAIREQIEPDKSPQLAIEVLYRPVAEPAPRAQPLALRHLTDPIADERGRPAAPTLLALLEHHTFLALDLTSGMLSVPKGRHEVQGDLVIPEGHVLHLAAGAQLLMAPGAVVIAPTLVVDGRATEPAEFAPADEAKGWAGLLVTGRETNRLTHCRIRGTTAIDRGGWQTTGGVTFYHSPVEMTDCAFLDSRGEDACNIFGARFEMVRTEFRGAASDLLDGDFVNGEVVDCTFADSVGDAVDFSGSQVTVTGTRFLAIGDKAVSSGEESTMRVARCEVVSASIAVAAKDKSKVEIDGLVVTAVDNFVLAAYIKKPEYGPSSITARGLEWKGRQPRPDLAQTACSIVVDGVSLPTVDVDVGALYRAQVLGK